MQNVTKRHRPAHVSLAMGSRHSGGYLLVIAAVLILVANVLQYFSGTEAESGAEPPRMAANANR